MPLHRGGEDLHDLAGFDLIVQRERLDPTNPDVAAFITTSLRNMYRKGYRYFKIDFNNLPLMGVRLFNPKMTRLQAQRELFRLYREAIGPESYLMACNPDQRLFVGYADANRIGPDCLPFDGFTQKWASDDMPTNAWGLYYPIMAMAGRGTKTASRRWAIRMSLTSARRARPALHSY